MSELVDYIKRERPAYHVEEVIVLMKRNPWLSADGACGLIQQWMDWKTEEREANKPKADA